ncbi:MAG: phosphopantetheine-binding protein [Acidobacteriota bacterium]|nr:phosphopantetheine-binding protein [Acidobacteriota bacterium]
MVRTLEENDLDASWLFQELPVPPRNPQEALLAEIWEEVLSQGDVGVEDNFFDLGGDSILSVRIVAKARERGLVFSSRQLFEYPTIASLVEVAEVADSPHQSPSSTPSQPSPTQQLPTQQLEARQDPHQSATPATVCEASEAAAADSDLSPEAFPEADLSEEELGRVLDLLAQRQADSDGRMRFAADDSSSVEPAGELPRLLALRSARF